MVKDPRLLLGVVDNMLASMEQSMSAILTYERMLRIVPVYNNTFESKFNTFRLRSLRRNNISHEIVNTMMELRNILIEHKKSPMEFQRGNRIVICDKDYRLSIVSIKDLHRHLEKTKELMDNMQTIISKYDK
ncbi:MAG: hypothetical protein Q7J06_07010 [Bacteroidales bacterium]|nr:hypothetical protein [Bacteroidales bacterium]